MCWVQVRFSYYCLGSDRSMQLESHSTHHAAVEILLHLAEGVRRRFSLAWNNDADVGDSQGGVRLALRRPSVGDIDALGGVATDVGWATEGCGLDEVAALLQPLLPLVQHTEGGGTTRQSAKVNSTSACSY